MENQWENNLPKYFS